MEHYTYILLDPRKKGAFSYNGMSFSEEPFYVGKGKGNRFKSNKGRSLHFEHKIEAIKRAGFLMLSEANPFRGKQHSEEAKRKMKESWKTREGTPHTEEAKEKIRQSKLGKPRSEETKQKIRDTFAAKRTK